MTPHYQTDEVTVYHGDCVEVREAEYLPLIVARLHKPMQVGFDFEGQI